jgi:hypothetical protein
VPAPAGLPGVNLLDDAAVAARRQIFGECSTHTLVDLDDPAQSLLWRWTIRDDAQGGQSHRWKLIVPTSADAGGEFPSGPAGRVDPHSQEKWQRREIELFDLAADPDETKNLAAAEPEIVRELSRSLAANWSPQGARANAAAAAAEPARLPGRRSGRARPRLHRQHVLPDAGDRPARGRGGAVHPGLRRLSRLLALAGRAHDRPASGPRADHQLHRR